jgi:membrane protease YdiL (CAAX protease family)
MARPSPALYPDCPATAVEAARVGLPLRPTTWSAWDALWAMLGSFVIGAAAGAVFFALGAGPASGWLLLAIALPWVAMAGWPLFVTRRRGNGPVVDLGLRFDGRSVGHGVLGGLASLAVALVLTFVSVALFGPFSSSAGDTAVELAQENGPAVMLVFAVMVTVGAPFAEELTFRGLLWSGLAKRGVAEWVAVLVSAAAFALLHFEPQRLLLLFGVGVVLGLVRWRTRSLGACIVAHGVNNLPGALGIFALSFGIPMS